MGSSPTRGSSFFLGKVTGSGVLCYFALFVFLTLLAFLLSGDHTVQRSEFTYLLREDVSIHELHHLLIGPGKVGSDLLD